MRTGKIVSVGKFAPWQRYEQKLSDAKRQYTALFRAAFPDVGKFHVQGWPIPGKVSLTTPMDLEPIPENILQEYDETKRQLIREGEENSKEGRLLFSYPPWRRALPDRHLLSEFLNLAEGTAEDVQKFAKKYGPLNLQEESIDPDGHRWNPHPNITFLAKPDTFYLHEYVGLWKFAAAEYKKLIETADLIRSKKPVPDEFWSDLDRKVLIFNWNRDASPLGLRRSAPEPGRLDFTRKLGEALDRYREVHPLRLPKEPWAHFQGVMIAMMGGDPFDLPMHFSIRDGHLSLNLAASLSTYLKMQLLTAVGRGPGLAMCAGCSTFFLPKRRVPPDRQAWCTKCARDGASVRAASRRYYAGHKFKVIARINQSRGQKKVEVDI